MAWSDSLLSKEGPWAWAWLMLLGWLMLIYLLVNYRLPKMLTGGLNIYLAQPLMWTALAIMAYLGWRFGLRERPQISKGVLSMAALLGLFQVALFVLAGLLYGFGNSPYDHSLPALLGNLLYATTMLIGIELARAYYAALFSQGSRILGLLLPSALFTFLSIPAARFSSMTDILGAFRLSGEILLPTAAENLLATVLVLIGGPIASMVYRGVLLASEWLSPILPNLEWTLTAFVGTLAPILGMLVIGNWTRTHAEKSESSEGDQTSSSSSAWMVLGAMAVAIIWLNTGLFGVRPTLVSGVSMEPAMNAGDIAITRDVSPEEVGVGDVIRFREGETYILHRVIEIESESGGTTFITQGDANNTVDAPVEANRLEGKVILTVPKIGWIGIGVRMLVDWIL